MELFFFIGTDAQFGITAALFAIALPFLLSARYIDARTLNGDSIWSKPFIFALSFAVHFGTFAIIAHWLPSPIRLGVGLRCAADVSIAAGLFELSYITIQAARGRHSHFNLSAPVEAVCGVFMGVGAVLILVPAVVIGFDVAVGPLPEWAGSIRTGVALGLLGSAALTTVTGFQMGRSLGYSPRTSVEESQRIPVLGWSLDRVDLRPAHFLAAHMMQAIPATAVIVAMLLPTAPALIVSGAIGAGWFMLTLWALAWGSAGRPLPMLSVLRSGDVQP